MSQVTGNDAVSLVCNATEIQDVIGQTSLAPASGQWGTGNASTADNTIRRMCNVTIGDRQGIDDFDPVFQWNGFAANTSGDLGIRFCP